MVNIRYIEYRTPYNKIVGNEKKRLIRNKMLNLYNDTIAEMNEQNGTEYSPVTNRDPGFREYLNDHVYTVYYDLELEQHVIEFEGAY